MYVEFVYKLIPSYQIMICFGITIDILGVRNQMSFYLYFEFAAIVRKIILHCKDFLVFGIGDKLNNAMLNFDENWEFFLMKKN